MLVEFCTKKKYNTIDSVNYVQKSGIFQGFDRPKTTPALIVILGSLKRKKFLSADQRQQKTRRFVF